MPQGVCTCSGLPNALRLSHTETALDGSLLIITKGPAVTLPNLKAYALGEPPAVMSLTYLALRLGRLRSHAREVSVKMGDTSLSTLP